MFDWKPHLSLSPLHWIAYHQKYGESAKCVICVSICYADRAEQMATAVAKRTSAAVPPVVVVS
jgi:hypothetical protein